MDMHIQCMRNHCTGRIGLGGGQREHWADLPAQAFLTSVAAFIQMHALVEATADNITEL